MPTTPRFATPFLAAPRLASPRGALLSIGTVLLLAVPATIGAESLDDAFAERFGGLALECVDREYPNKIAHVMTSDDDARPPRELTPAFFGCYDWHSAVHAHWLLARLARERPDSPLSARAKDALERHLTPENLDAEARYLAGDGRVSFERPYGLAWLLQLAAELREWDDPDARRWQAAIEPLETMAAERIRDWAPKLTHPIRSGEHSQTAFAFGLVLDWARIAGDLEMSRLMRERIATLYLLDRACPLDYEPSGHDFLSPCLAEADLVRRMIRRTDFAAWLGGFLPRIPLGDGPPVEWLEPAVSSDPGDPKLAHLDGLNLSRAWMLEGIITGLPTGDPRIPDLLAAARAHRDAGLAAVTGEHYEGGHWLGSFATYLTTGRGGGNVLSRGPIDVVFRGLDRAAAKREALERVEQGLEDVTAYLGIEYDGKILVDVGPENRVPYQTGNSILLPARGIEGASIVHEVTHVVAPSAYRRRPDRFYDDGLAVYLETLFGIPTFPNYDNDLHQETVALAAELGGFLPLETTEKTRQETHSRDERRLAYLQEGSFTRFLIETHGLEKYWRVYNGASLAEVYGRDLQALETEWRALLEPGS